jgi:transposase
MIVKCCDRWYKSWAKVYAQSRFASFSTTFFSIKPTMPRTPLAAISTNSNRGKELSPYLRGQIIAYSNCGLNPSQIGRELEIPRSAVRTTLQRDPQRIDGKSCARTGGPKSYTERDSRHILTIIKRNPFVTYRTIREQTGLDVSRRTFLRILKESGYGHWRAQKRPKLTDEHAKIRLE